MEIKSTEEALNYLYSLSLNESSIRFRGQSSFLWTLQPSIHRYYNFQRYQTVDYESNIILFKPQNPEPPLTYTDFELEWLMICQHYGIPTRLLDWTNQILVALFFACHGVDEIEKDGALFICNQDDYPKFDLYKEKANEIQELSFISTNIRNPRMRTQSGCFMIWGHAPLKNDKSKESYDLWQYHNELENSKNLIKIRIPSEAKNIILNELEEFHSINHGNIFLENGYLERSYSSRIGMYKEMARLMTLYKTDADSLNLIEEQKAKSLFRVDCRNMFRNCVSLTKM